MPLLLCGLLLSSCTFSVPQFEASIRLIEHVVSGRREVVAQETVATWLASVGGQGAVLNPYVSDGLTIFANAEGDGIAFDGWTIRSIIGFGLSSPVSVIGKDGTRVFSYDGVQTQTYCDTWTRSDLYWEQACLNGDGHIKVDETGNIVAIAMALDEPFGIVTLTVVK